jgi:hypothetical protein
LAVIEIEMKIKSPRDLLLFLDELCARFQGRSKGITFGYKLGPVTEKQKAHKMLEITITNEQQVNVTLKPVTATGKAAKLDGAPTWTIQSGDSKINVPADGLSADLISSDTPGDTEILVEADADLGSGVVSVSDIIRLTVAGAQAANLGLAAGAPTAKP